MCVAFDCQGVLISDGPTPDVLETRTRGLVMPELLDHLVRGGAEVYCVSAAPAGHPRAAYEGIARLLTRHGIPVHGIYPTPVGRAPFETGVNKAAAMGEADCWLMFDDHPEVCRGVRSTGLIAIQYSTAWE